MKIGILTFHKSINYGSVLQALSLQRTLSDMGVESEIIDYEPERYKMIYNYNIRDAKNVKQFIKRMFVLRKYADKQKKLFLDFRKHWLKSSIISYDVGISYEYIKNEYDAFITGSDQIWNIDLPDCDPIYFLPFKFNGKKVAYACSVNDAQLSKQKKYTKEWLKECLDDYDIISIRENSGVKNIENFLGGYKTVYRAIDPTLLHDAHFYCTFIRHRIIDDDYIFMYNMWSKRDCLIIAKYVSEKTGLPVYCLTNQMDGVYWLKYTINGVHVDINNTGPDDFLSYVYYSKFVVTDSFHGTAFSIIFNKQFYTVNNRLDSGKYKNDERLYSILNDFGLLNRFVKASELDSLDCNEKVSFSDVNKQRMKLSLESIAILKRGLGVS